MAGGFNDLGTLTGLWLHAQTPAPTVGGSLIAKMARANALAFRHILAALARVI